MALSEALTLVTLGPDDVPDGLALSDAAGWISGQVIGLDGGFQAVRPYVKTA